MQIYPHNIKNNHLNSDVNIVVGGISGYNTKTIENSYNSEKIELKVYNELTKKISDGKYSVY